MNIFWGYQDFVNIVGGSSQNWASFKVISMHFRDFLRSRYRIGIFLGVAKISNIFFGVLDIPDIFGVKDRCWVRAYVCGKNRVPGEGGRLKCSLLALSPRPRFCCC